MPRDSSEWLGLVEAANAISGILKRKPKVLRKGFGLHPGGILNAFREGDVSFRQAVKQLHVWHRRQSKIDARWARQRRQFK